MSKIIPPSTAFDDGIVLLQGWPEYLNGKPHSGIDIYAQSYRGHKPRATEDGEIVDVIVGNAKKVSCIVLEVESTKDRLEYKHCTAKVKIGQTVCAGDILGVLNDSGKDSGWWQGYHLHFGIRECPTYEANGDPIIYFLHAMPDMVFYARKNIVKYYKKKNYYELMTFKPIPWEV